MKLLLIAPESFPKPEIPYFVCEIFTPTNNLERDIESIKNIKADLIIIPAEQSTTYLDLHLLGGLELLVWLRIKGVDTHIVVTSFFPLQSVLQKTKLGFIFGSKGVSFHQLPKRISHTYLENLVTDKAKKQNLKPYVSAIFDNVGFRHAYANIWGLTRLIEVQNKIFPKEPFEFNFVNNSAINSLNYNIGRFLFSKKQSSIDKETEKKISDFSRALKNHKNLNILYIDDKADQGWLNFLKHLFDHTVNFYTLDLESKDLYQQFLDLKPTNLEPFNFIISDLRLYPAEDNITDYDQFISIQLMKKIFDTKNKNDKEKYPQLKYLLFTASNQLLNYKTIIARNKYTPSALFIKEGFDIQNNANQQYKNFLNLLQSLNKISQKGGHRNNRNSEAMVERYDEPENIKIENFDSKLKNNNWEADIEKQNKLFEQLGLTHIILDTNLYLEEEPILPLTKNEKIILTYPVYKELERIKHESEESLRKYLSEYFTSSNNSLAIGLDTNDIKQIDSKINGSVVYADLADGYFKKIICAIIKIPGSKVLFVTNDIKEKNGKKDPYHLIKDWIRKEKILNVTVSFFKDKKFEKEIYEQIESMNLRLSPTSNDRLKIKWKDCEFNEQEKTLSCSKKDNEVTIKIGEEHDIEKFKRAFNLLKKTKVEMEIEPINEDGYSILYIANILKNY
jgi:hypothetical protein